MPRPVLPKYQAETPAAAAAAPAAAGTDAAEEDGQHAADRRGGAAAGPALPHSCHAYHADEPAAHHPTDTSAPAPSSAPAYTSQQHAAVLAHDSGCWP